MADFQSARIFRVSSFNPTHRQLIIRSDPEFGPGNETRIELYFGNVEYLAMRPILQGIRVHAASLDERDIVRDRFGIESNLEYLFRLDDSTPMSFVISGNPSWRSGIRAVDEPSLFDFSQAWPPGPDVSWGTVE